MCLFDVGSRLVSFKITHASFNFSLFSFLLLSLHLSFSARRAWGDSAFVNHDRA
jgi:hypothetical protein